MVVYWKETKCLDLYENDSKVEEMALKNQEGRKVTAEMSTGTTAAEVVVEVEEVAVNTVMVVVGSEGEEAAVGVVVYGTGILAAAVAEAMVL
jgi:hypothetical protein